MEPVICFFIGGPWNNRLLRVNLHSSCRVPIPLPLEPFWASDGPVLMKDVIIQTVDYYPDAPLPSGVPVYSCLDQVLRDRGFPFYHPRRPYPVLRSVRQ